MIRYIPLIFMAGLLAEIASLVIVGGWIGVVPVLLLVCVDAVAGIALIRTGGMSLAAAIRRPPRLENAQSGQPFGGVFRVFAGLLLIVPGFVSDAAGLCLLLPPVQRWIMSFFDAALSAHHRPVGPIIESEAVEIDGGGVDASRPGNGQKRLGR